MSCACLSSSRLKFSAEPMKQRSCPRNGHVLLQAVQAAQLSINARRDSSYRATAATATVATPCNAAQSSIKAASSGPVKEAKSSAP